ncbi:MAG: phosphatidate cytidylyltransferase [Planctomycetes bacterium]|nr:phosphatidate cytidylyltransferase [Planctomycetota bacterium]
MNFEMLAPSGRWFLAAIGGALVLATIIVQTLVRLKPRADLSSLRQRINSWWVMTGVFTLAMVLSRDISIGFFAFISFLALKEFFSLIPTRRTDRLVLFWAYLAIPLQFYWVYLEWYGMFIVFIPVYMFLLLPMRMVLIGQTQGHIRAAGTIHWGLMLTVFCLSHTAFLLVLQEKTSPGEFPGPGLVLFLVVLTQANDVFQFLWGKSLGRAKILPQISPGKTWAGFLGGVATTTAIAWQAGPFLTILNDWQSLVAGLIIGISGFMGDVNLSALKRDLQVKDSGSLLPGHGGILDRVDSLTYTAPLFFHFVYWSFDFHTFGTGIGK